MEACTSKSSLLHSPLRTIPKLRLTASVSSDDVANGRCHVGEQHVHVEGKNYSRSVFDHVFRPEATQEDMYTAFLADTIQSVFAGNDATVLAMGAKSNGKDGRLYGDSVSRNGLIQLAITQMMSALDENKDPEDRVQLRMSAIMVSQKDAHIVDLLSPFNPDPRHRVVRLVDDARTGVFIDNESEIRVETVDQALFYLNTAVDHRMIQDEQTHRTSHVFISLTLYSYKMGDKMQGGRRRLCFLDMGIGERHSTNGMTMPALGSILLAMVQRNKHIPSRDSSVCQLIRCALATSRFTTFLFSFGAKNDDNDNIAALACKIGRTRAKTSSIGHGRKSVSNLSAATGTSDASSSTDTRPQRRFELESGSELSAAETVIFLGPSTSRTASPAASTTMPSTPTSVRPLHRTSRNTNVSNEPLSKPLTVETKTSPTHSCHDGCIHSIPPMLRGHTPFLSASLKLYDELCSPPGSSRGGHSQSHSPNAFGGNTAEKRDDFGVMLAQPAMPVKSKSRYNLDDGKMKQIMQWMETSEAPPILFSSPCYENGATSVEELRECVGILSHPLEDIIEIEEESMRTSTATTGGSKKDHPLRILSKQDLNIESESKDKQEESELELVMAASLSSMKSHDILAKLEAIRNAQNGNSALVSASSNTEDVSEMDVYRRASHLEEYAMQRVREIEENKLKKNKKAKLGGLNCCQQQSMISSGSTVVDWSQIERKKEKEREVMEEEKRKDLLRERRAKLKITELELKRERNLIDKELDDKKGIANSIARQLQHFSLSPCRGGRTHRSVSTHRIDPPNGSLPSTPTMSHKKVIGGSLVKLSGSSGAPPSPALGYHQSLPRHSKLPTAVNGRRPSAERERKSSKSSRNATSSKERERRSSGSKEDLLQWRSPYAQMTSPKTYGGPGTSSSGRGSSAPGSDFDTTAVSATEKSTNGTMPRSKRQSYSASSGYESANDYHIYATSSKKASNVFDKKMNELSLVKQADEIRHRQRQLKKELEEAKRAIGQEDDAKMIANSSDQRMNGLSRTTMIDAMLQENRILEKRIVACRNHSMLVTTFI